MRFFRRSLPDSPPPTAEPTAPPERRRAVMACCGCKRVNPPYVYMENERDYCVHCAVELRWQWRMKPAGRRNDDPLHLVDA